MKERRVIESVDKHGETNGYCILPPLPEDNPFIKRFAGILACPPEVIAKAFERDAGLDVLVLKKAHRAE